MSGRHFTSIAVDTVIQLLERIEILEEKQKDVSDTGEIDDPTPTEAFTLIAPSATFGTGGGDDDGTISWTYSKFGPNLRLTFSVSGIWNFTSMNAGPGPEEFVTFTIRKTFPFPRPSPTDPPFSGQVVSNNIISRSLVFLVGNDADLAGGTPSATTTGGSVTIELAGDTTIDDTWSGTWTYSGFIDLLVPFPSS